MDVEKVLVVGASGRQGFPICSLLIDSKKFEVFGTSRNAKNVKLHSKGIKVVPFIYGDENSITEALRLSQATLVYFLTDLDIAQNNQRTEVEHGRIIVDACKKAGVKFIVYSSIDSADSAPKEARYFRTKVEIESMLKNSGISFAIIRPPTFFETFDDGRFFNPLKKRYVKGIFDSSAKIPMVATVDIAKTVVTIFLNREKWNGKTIHSVSSILTGNDLAAALTAASGLPCKHAVVMPKLYMRLFLPDLYRIARYYEEGSKDPAFLAKYQQYITEFKEIVPDPLTIDEWFEQKGQWANGEKFGELAPVHSAKENSSSWGLYLTVGVGILAIAYAYYGKRVWI